VRHANNAKPGRFSIPVEIVLLLVCAGAAGLAAIGMAWRCLGETGDYLLPGTKVSAVCASTAPQDWFLAGVGAAAVIVLVGVVLGHARDRRRPALVGASISIGLTAMCLITGFAFKVSIMRGR